ncbi:MAG: hypothetical protein JKX87_00415, partial [Cycloclasticus sp.]|nr:hypothetical protein [Cycloclasticus sp.]
MKIIRIIILLCILVVAAFYTKLQRLESTAWLDTLSVAIYPINGDGNSLTDEYIATLTPKSFSRIDVFFKRQWYGYKDLEFDPVASHLQAEILSQPPTPPTDGNVLKVMIWSLRLRFWAYQNSVDADKSTVNIYVRYHQPRQSGPLAHSLGLQKGLIGVVNAYASADYQQRNNIVIAHELLHTVGASDKYSLTTGQPIYPDGFANPSAEYGQSKAEIMAGKIPLSEDESVMP